VEILIFFGLTKSIFFFFLGEKRDSYGAFSRLLAFSGLLTRI